MWELIVTFVFEEPKGYFQFRNVNYEYASEVDCRARERDFWLRPDQRPNGWDRRWVVDSPPRCERAAPIA